MERATLDPDLKRLNATLYDFALVHNQENPDMSSAYYRREERVGGQLVSEVMEDRLL
jgi:hypothetical protein